MGSDQAKSSNLKGRLFIELREMCSPFVLLYPHGRLLTGSFFWPVYP